MSAGHSRPDPHRPKRSLGQNFLVDPNLQRRIVDALEPSPEDEVLEIGPGLGALTQHLAGRVRRLVLVELDDDLAHRLAQRFRDDPSVEVVHADILSLDLPRILHHPETAKVIGNIPYNITTPILFHLLESHPRPAAIVLMVQREVADRIVAPPGTRTYGALAVGVQAVADVQRVLHVSRNAFRPVPDVESSVLRLTPRRDEALTPSAERALRHLTRIAFGHRRKQFQRILRDAFALSTHQVDDLARDTGFDLRARPETFSPADLIRLSTALSARGLI